MCHANILWAWGSSSSLAWSTSMQNTVLTWESAIIPTFQLHDITFRMLFLLLGALSYVWGILRMHDGWQQALCLPVSEVHCKGIKELKVNPFSAEQKHGGSSTTVMVKLHFTCNFHSLALHFAFKWVKASTKLKVVRLIIETSLCQLTVNHLIVRQHKPAEVYWARTKFCENQLDKDFDWPNWRKKKKKVLHKKGCRFP